MFVERYPRATEAVNKIYDIFPEDPPVWIAIPSNRWKNYKKAVKIYWSWFIRIPIPGSTGDKLLNKCLVDYKKLIVNNLGKPV